MIAANRICTLMFRRRKLRADGCRLTAGCPFPIQLVGVKGYLKVILRLTPRLRGGPAQPFTQILLLSIGEELLDLVCTTLQRLKKAGPSIDIERRGPDIYVGIRRRRFPLFSVALNPN